MAQFQGNKFQKFLSDVSKECLPSKKDVLKIAIYLGVAKPKVTIEAMLQRNPRDIKQVIFTCCTCIIFCAHL